MKKWWHRPEGVSRVDAVGAAVCGVLFAVVFRPWGSVDRFWMCVGGCICVTFVWHMLRKWFR
jgi:hypothetical protein